MKRLGTLTLAILLLTSCNAMKPNMEETELLWRETEKRIETWALPTKVQSNPTETLPAIREPESKIPQKTPAPTQMPTPRPQTATPSPGLSASEESLCQPNQATPPQEEKTDIVDWPYITCPPEPERPQITAPEPPAATPWPYITAPEPPTYTPEPETMEPTQEEHTPTPQPVPVDPIAPTPEPTEQPANPTPEPPTEQPSTGYAECSCGATLTPEELVPHMKFHAMNGENHSYRAY